MKVITIFFLTILLSLLLAQNIYAQQQIDAISLEPKNIATEFINFLKVDQPEKAIEYFDENMKQALNSINLANIWKSFEVKYGPFIEYNPPREYPDKYYIIVLITCQFKDSALDAKFFFDSNNKITNLEFLPFKKDEKEELTSYLKNTNVLEEEITFGSSPWILPGTISKPKNGGPFPIVVLVNGYGPHDRDGKVDRVRPFRDLALGLASNGIAVMRYDNRLKQYPEEMLKIKGTSSPKEEITDDVLEAIGFLQTRKDIDQNNIFILGYDLGGMLIPRIAYLLDNKSAGFIILAGPTLSLEDVLYLEMAYLFELDGVTSPEEKQDLAIMEQKANNAKSPKLTITTPSSELPLNMPATYFLYLRNYKPTEAIKSVEQPILILHGDRDYQVTRIHFSEWEKATTRMSNVKLVAYPMLNHMFIEGKSKSTPEDYQKSGHVSESIINDIAEWIKNPKFETFSN